MSGKKSASPDRTAYDGWALAYAPFSPPAIHLLALLADESDGPPALVLLPAPSFHPLPERVNSFIFPTASEPAGQLLWQQFHLPRLAARHAGRLHLVTPSPPLACAVPVDCSPAEWGTPPPTPRTLARRLAQSLAAGGMAGLRSLVWPADLSAPAVAAPLDIRPPRVHPFFRIAQPQDPTGSPKPAGPDLQDYVLYAGPRDPSRLRLLLEGWSWASPALGNATPLVLPAAPGEGESGWEWLKQERDWGDTVQAVSPADLPGLAELYQRAALVVHLGPARPWGDPLAAALACGQALVAEDEPFSAARSGPAAYLVSAGDPRALGAAILAVLVEESLAEQLRAAARQKMTV